MKYERTTETEYIRHRVTERYRDSEPPTDDDTRPSFGPLRVVVVDGEAVEETVRPLAKCRQVTPVNLPRVKAG